MTLEEAIDKYDRIERKRFDERDVEKELQTVDDDEENPAELKIELLAFAFSENYQEKGIESPHYFGPFMVQIAEDGTRFEIPSISMITNEAISHWTARAKESINPILKARYCGLVWEFGQLVTGRKPDHEICRLYIKSLLKIVNGDFSKYHVYAFTKLERALKLSLQLNDPTLINECKDSILLAEKKYSIDSKPGLWGHAFDLLTGNKKITLSRDEEKGIIDELENKLSRLTDLATEQKIDPWAAKSAADRLATYYKKAGENEDVRRVVIKIGQAVEAIRKDGSKMQVISWLEDLRRFYAKFGLNEEAEAILIELRKLGPSAAAEMGVVSSKLELPKEKIEQFLGGMVSDNVSDTLHQIVVQFIPNIESAKEELLKLSKSSPILYLARNQIQDRNGRTIATVGPLSEDIEGHIVRRVSEKFSFSSLFLALTFRRAKEKLKLDSEGILKFIERTPLIKPERKELLRIGLNAYFNGDPATSIHLIIPQVEEAIRNLLELSGGNVLRAMRDGSYQLRTFDDLLRDEIVEIVLGKDLVCYFRILFTDQRGWNLRNIVCHGMAEMDTFKPEVAEWVIHALLCLGLFEEKSQD